ncbi:MAG: phytoene/squalene synthase family protein [Pleomorphochaeta sp.]
MESNSLKKDYKYCEKLIKKSSKTYYKAFVKLPIEKRKAVFAVYAYCRYADDIIDIEKDRNKLHSLLRELDDFNKGLDIDNTIFRVLRDVFNKYDMDIAPFYDMISGQKMDLDFNRIETIEDLDNYCYYVASSVGLMILPIIAEKNYLQLANEAIALGKAMQFTNILRDIGEDSDNGRIYLPLDLIKKFNVNIEDIKNKKVTDEFILLWEYLANIAQDYFNNFYKVVKRFDSDSIEAVLSSAVYYNAILDVVRENDYDCLSKRNIIIDYNIFEEKYKKILE